MLKKILLPVFMLMVLNGLARESGNRPDRLETFQDMGLGLFIHWSIDSQIGSVISHSLVGTSEAYAEAFFQELPQTFNPTEFNADEWARLAKIAGFQYVVFTTKHHSGFCMYDTQTNDFDVLSTPYGKDITKEIVDAFRAQGIAIGFYFSPDDFYVLHQQGKLISRRRPTALPTNNAELMQHNKKQIAELFGNYGPVDVLFIDGEPDGLKELAWSLQPTVVVTRGALNTPEITPSTGQSLPQLADIEPWEACFTMGTSWQYKPTHERYMTGTEIIQLLIETRAKGGNMLLNIGPEPNGEIPQPQEDKLRELALWMFVNNEAIYNVRPWSVPRQDNIWFTKAKNEDTVYAIVTNTDWPWGEEKEILLNSVEISENSQVTVLGQNDKVLEYNLERIPKTTWEQTSDGLKVTATRAQRLYNDRTWPNPVVFKITNVKIGE